MDENNEDQCLKIPEMLKKCNFLEGNDKNTCIQNVRKLIKSCTEAEENRKKLIGSVLSVT